MMTAEQYNIIWNKLCDVYAHTTDDEAQQVIPCLNAAYDSYLRALGYRQTPLSDYISKGLYTARRNYHTA